MLFNILWFLFLGISTLLTILPLILYFLLGLLGLKNIQRKFLMACAHYWGKIMIKSSGSKVSITGLENLPKQDNLLFVSNHQGNADIPLIFGYIPKLIGFIAKIELKKMPILNIWMILVHSIFMDRKNLRQSHRVIEKGIENLNKGHALVIFPEGTRSKSSKMNHFKKGSLKLALKSNVMIVPLTINGSYKMFEANGNKIKPAKISLHIHPPIDVKKLSEEEKKKLTEIVETQIRTKLNEMIDD